LGKGETLASQGFESKKKKLGSEEIVLREDINYGGRGGGSEAFWYSRYIIQKDQEKKESS